MPQRKKTIYVKWVFKVKTNLKSEVIKHNARLVTKIFMQREGIYFEKVFALVEIIQTIRLVVAIENRNNLVHLSNVCQINIFLMACLKKKKCM